MPFVRCPKCQNIHHFNTGDISEWYRRFAPDKQVGELVEMVCFACWEELPKEDNEFSN